MALNTYDEANIARIFNEVLDERERRSHFNIHLAIEEVRQAYAPLMSPEERRRMQFDDELRPLDAQLVELEREVAVVFPQGNEAENDRLSERAFVLMRYFRRAAKAARERGLEDIAEHCMSQSTRIENFLTGTDK